MRPPGGLFTKRNHGLLIEFRDRCENGAVGLRRQSPG